MADPALPSPEPDAPSAAPDAPAPASMVSPAPARRASPPDDTDVDADVDRVVHEYDGIQEYDNRLPNWWLYTLYATMVFALGYWFHYQGIKSGELPGQAYEREMASVYAAEAARIRAQGLITPASLLALSHDPGTVAQGRELFASTCAPCHGANAGGNIGPNLTDEFWLHGGAPDRVFHTVSEGVTARGMPAWGPQLGNDRVQAVVAYVITLRNSNAAGGKPPQGEREP